MTFGEYWEKIRNNYDYLVITYPDGDKYKLNEENSDILSESEVDLKKIEKYNEFWENNPDGPLDYPKYAEPGSAGHVELYYEKGGTKLTFHFPYEREIEVGKGYIMAETIDVPSEKLKLQFFKNNIVNCT